MTQQHPITPPLELVVQWIKELSQPNNPRWQEYEQDIANRAARWGADQELEACRMEIIDGAGRFYIDETSDRVRLAEDIWTARRPKSPSLKEKALKELAWVDEHLDMPLHNHCTAIHTIRRALEQLDD
jgi:hypothetical protein